jgi:hypothetical protein
MLTDFYLDEAKFFLFLLKKKSKWPTQKNHSFSTPPILNIFLRKFQGLVLELVEKIDAKGINVGQPIWSSGCPT